MAQCKLVDVTIPMAHELLDDQSADREELREVKARLKRGGMADAEIALLFESHVDEDEGSFQTNKHARALAIF